MKTRRLQTFLVLLALGPGATTAWSGQDAVAATATDAHASANGTAAGEGGKRVPGIVSEEEIPAYLITDPCDTTDS